MHPAKVGHLWSVLGIALPGHEAASIVAKSVLGFEVLIAFGAMCTSKVSISSPEDASALSICFVCLCVCLSCVCLDVCLSLCLTSAASTVMALLEKLVTPCAWLLQMEQVQHKPGRESACRCFNPLTAPLQHKTGLLALPLQHCRSAHSPPPSRLPAHSFCDFC